MQNLTWCHLRNAVKQTQHFTWDHRVTCPQTKTVVKVTGCSTNVHTTGNVLTLFFCLMIALAVCSRIMRWLFVYAGWNETLFFFKWGQLQNVGHSFPWSACNWPRSLSVTWPAALTRETHSEGTKCVEPDSRNGPERLTEAWIKPRKKYVSTVVHYKF